MPGTNQILQFAGGGGANVLSPAAYAALTSIVANGFTSGVLPSNQLNVVLRQSAFVASMVAQFIADQSGQNVNDDGNLATLETNFGKALQAFHQGALYAVDTGTANVYQVAYTPAITAVTDGMVLRFKAKVANTGASTFAPNAVAAAPIWGGDHAALGGGEIIANSDVWVQWNSSLNGGSGAWVLVDSTGGFIKGPTPTTGDRSNKMATTQMFANEFAATLAAGGSQKLSSGFIVKWGNANPSASPGTTVTFPVAFPNAIFAAVSGGNSGGYTYTATETAANLKLIGSAGGVYWIAVGW